MPRGTQTLEIITPMEGARFDLPIHKLQPDMLAAGSFNVVCDPTNLLRARNGFLRIAPPGPVAPLTGGISWQGFGTNFRTLVADTGLWWSYSGGLGGTFTALSGAAPTTSFTQFAVFWVNGADILFGVNDDVASGLLEWIPGSNSIEQVPGLPFQTALDIFVLANRLVVVGTVEGGVRYPSRVRWSQVNNPTVFPAQAVADILDPGGPIIAALRMGALQAFIYMAGTEGTGQIEAMIAQPGDDANAFSFQEFALGEGAVPPVSVAAIMSIEGIHYYLGQDGHIWQFNGVAPINFGIPVQSDIFANANFSALANSFALYVPGDRHARFYFPSGTATYPNRCVYYSLDFNRWEAPAQYNQQFRCGFTGPLSSITEQAAFVGGVDGGFYQMDGSVLDDGAPIEFAAIWGAVTVSALNKMQVQFVEVFLAQEVTGDQILFTVSGLREPLGALDGGVGYVLQLSQENQFQMMSAPGRGAPGSEYYNWLQVSLTGRVSGTLKFAGAYVQVDTLQKGVYARDSSKGPS